MRDWATGENRVVRRGFYSTKSLAAEELWQSHEKLRSYAEDLERFNRVAVGRETRMVELKKEINALCQRHGEPARYPLEFEQEGGNTNV